MAFAPVEAALRLPHCEAVRDQRVCLLRGWARPESENKCLPSCPAVPFWATVNAYGGLVCDRQLATFSQYKREFLCFALWYLCFYKPCTILGAV